MIVDCLICIWSVARPLLLLISLFDVHTCPVGSSCVLRVMQTLSPPVDGMNPSLSHYLMFTERAGCWLHSLDLGRTGSVYQGIYPDWIGSRYFHPSYLQTTRIHLTDLQRDWMIANPNLLYLESKSLSFVVAWMTRGLFLASLGCLK